MGLICYCCFSLTKLEIVISPSITQKEERRIIHQRIALPLPFLIPILFFFYVLVYKDFINQSIRRISGKTCICSASCICLRYALSDVFL